MVMVMVTVNLTLTKTLKLNHNGINIALTFYRRGLLERKMRPVCVLRFLAEWFLLPCVPLSVGP